MDKSPLREKILATIIKKSALKQHTFDNTFAAFNELKDVLFEIASEMDDELDGKLDKRVRIEYRDRGKFEAQLQIASDLLIFRMHTDIFEFDSNHIIWQNDYVRQSHDNSYCGVIDIYNFLSDSFKFNRNADEGYLIGRIFINREKCFFVEGKRQTLVRPGDHLSRGTDCYHGDSHTLCYKLRPAPATLRGQQASYRRPVQLEDGQLEICHRQTFGIRI